MARDIASRARRPAVGSKGLWKYGRCGEDGRLTPGFSSSTGEVSADDARFCVRCRAAAM